MSFEKSKENINDHETGEKAKNRCLQIKIEGPERDQSLDGRSVAFSHLNQLRNEMVEPEDGKSTLHFPDNKSMFSQFDVMSQYSTYIESKQQTRDHNL